MSCSVLVLVRLRCDAWVGDRSFFFFIVSVRFAPFYLFAGRWLGAPGAQKIQDPDAEAKEE